MIKLLDYLSEDEIGNLRDAGKIFVYYHADCADGIIAALCAFQFLGHGATYYPVKYNDKRSEDLFRNNLPGSLSVVLDFSFSPELHQQAEEESAIFIWMDHHESAFKARGLPYDAPVCSFNSEFVSILEPEKSGAMIAHEWFVDTDVYGPFWFNLKRLVEFVDDYDRWVHQFPESQAIIKALYTIHRWEFSELEADIVSPLYITSMWELGESLLFSHNAKVELLAEDPFIACFQSPKGRIVPGLIVNADREFASDLGHRLAKDCNGIGAVFQLNSNSVNISLRSADKETLNVGEIAAEFGGGGHAGAAGIVVPFNQFDIHPNMILIYPRNAGEVVAAA